MFLVNTISFRHMSHCSKYTDGKASWQQFLLGKTCDGKQESIEVVISRELSKYSVILMLLKWRMKLALTKVQVECLWCYKWATGTKLQMRDPIELGFILGDWKELFRSSLMEQNRWLHEFEVYSALSCSRSRGFVYRCTWCWVLHSLRACAQIGLANEKAFFGSEALARSLAQIVLWIDGIFQNSTTLLQISRSDVLKPNNTAIWNQTFDRFLCVQHSKNKS